MLPEPPTQISHLLGPNALQTVEGIIGYKFKKPFYLAQVLVSRFPSRLLIHRFNVVSDRRTITHLGIKAQTTKDWALSVMGYWISVSFAFPTSMRPRNPCGLVTIRHIYEREPSLAPGSLTLLKVGFVETSRAAVITVSAVRHGVEFRFGRPMCKMWDSPVRGRKGIRDFAQFVRLRVCDHNSTAERAARVIAWR